MELDTSLKAQSTQDSEPLEPFSFINVDGNATGIAVRDPQYQPGSIEYRLRSNDQYKAVNSLIFDSFQRYSNEASASDLRMQGEKIGDDLEMRDFTKRIRGLPELAGTNRTADDAAWYTVNVMQPQARHDAQYVFGKIRPLIQAKIEEAQSQGGSFYPADLKFEDIVTLASQAGVDPYVITKMAAEEAEKNPRKATKTYTFGQLKPMVDMMDIESQWGEMVFNDPQTHLFGKTGEAKRDAFRAMARWKDKHGVSLLGGAIDGILHLAVEGGYAVGGFAEGAIGTMVAVGTGGQVLMENGRTVLSDAWMQRPQKERDEAEQTLIKADALAKKYAPELVRVANDPTLSESDRSGKFAGVLERRFGQYADPAEIETFRRLSELRQKGAFRSQMSWERLANFGEGVMNTVPFFVKMFNSSIDPNSVFFRAEANIKSNAKSVAPIASFNLMLAENAVTSMSVYEAWVKGSQIYKDMESAELDKNISIWEENYRDIQGDGESVTGFFYRKSAEAAEAVGATGLAGLYREGERAAKGIMQEQRLIEAAALTDPILTVVGAVKLFGIGTKGAQAAAAQAALQNVSAELRAVTAEANKLRYTAGFTSSEFDFSVKRLRAELEARIPGAKFTDDDVIGIAVGDRKSVVGQLPAAQKIRTEIGKTISQNKSLAERVKAIQKTLDDVPDDIQGIDKLRARPALGAVVQAAGKTTGGAATTLNAIADFLDEGSSMKGGMIRRGVAKGARFLLQNAGGKGGQYSVSAALAGSYLLQGDILGAALAGGGYYSIGQLLRPDHLRSFGTTVSQVGRIQKHLASRVSEGRRYGDSTFLRTAIDLEEEARAINKTIVRTPGVPLSAADMEKAKKAYELANDATILRRMQKAGIEDGFKNATAVIWDDGVVAGTTGAIIAGMNDEDAVGAGAGLSIGFSASIRAANRLYRMTPAGADPMHARVVLGDVASIIDNIKDADQRGKVLDFIGRAGDDSEAYVRRASIVRDLFISLRGRAKFVNGTEFEAATILTASPEAEAKMILDEAAALHPSDPVKAKEYAASRSAQLTKAREAASRATMLRDQIVTNDSNIDSINRRILALDNEIQKLEQTVELEKVEWTDTKKVDENRIKLDRLKESRSVEETNLALAKEQKLALEGDAAKASGEARVEAPMRPYQQRVLPNGSIVRSVSDAFYVVDGPQGETVYVNIDKADNMAVVSEGWHALLADKAIQSLLPEMVGMMWGEYGTFRGGVFGPGGDYLRTQEGRVVYSAPGQNIGFEILNAYAADMDPAMRTKFLAEVNAGYARYKNSDFRDISGLVDPTREAYTWMMAAIDLRRRPGYRPGLETRPGMEAASTGTGTVRGGLKDVVKIIFGERTISDEARQFVTTAFDPSYGIFSRRYAAGVAEQLAAAGMRFIESGDGTLRGYFLNDKNEIVRSSVLNDFYDRVINITGGKGSPMLRPINLYDPMIPTEARVEFVKRNGMDWVLDENGTGIVSPDVVAERSTTYTTALQEALAGIPDDIRKLDIYKDPKTGATVYTGIPSAEEIAAIINTASVPLSFKRNLIMVMNTLATGESKAVLSAEYSNVFSVNTDAITDHRLRVGKDIAGKTEMRSVVPLQFMIGDSPVYGADGKPLKVVGADGKKVDMRQKTIKILGLDTKALTDSWNHASQQGLFIIDKNTGRREYLKDPSGNPYTAQNLSSLFGSEAEFWNKATLWMNHYYKNGPIDPFANIPTNPDGTPKTTIPVSAEILDPVNPARGAAIRDALRMIFGLESGKGRLGWVEDNRVTNTATGTVIRGTNFPITNFLLSQFGELKPNGQSMFIDQRGTTSGQFVMSVRDWESTKPLTINGKSNLTFTTVSELGGGQFITNPDTFNVTEVRTHPTLDDVKVFIGDIDIGGGKKEKRIAYTIGDGRVIMSVSGDLKNVIGEVRSKLSAREDAAWVAEAIKDANYTGEPLISTKAEPAKTRYMFEPPQSRQEVIDFIKGSRAQVTGRSEMTPALKEFLDEVNIDELVKDKGMDEVVFRLQQIAEEKSRSSLSSKAQKVRYKAAAEYLNSIWSDSYKRAQAETKAFRVPSNIDGFRPGDITKAMGINDTTNQYWWGVSSVIWEATRGFESGKYKNNREFFEAAQDAVEQSNLKLSDKIDELEALMKKTGPGHERYQSLLESRDRAKKELDLGVEAYNETHKVLQRLKKEAPELWQEPKPEAAAPEAAPAPEATKPVVEEAPMPERPPEVELTPQDVERLRRVRVSNDGNVKMESEVVLEEATNRRLRYNALLDWNRKQLEMAQALIDGSERAFQLDMRQTAESQAASDAGWEKYAGGKGQTALNRVKDLADLERRREIARRNEEVALTIKNEERLADLWQAEAERQARINKEAARKAQRLADESRARSEAARIAFEKGIEALKAKEAVKGEITRKLVSDALSSNAPLIAPGLLMVDIDRLPIAIERNVVVTDTINKPNVTTRQSVVYLRNWAGFEAQTQAFQQSFFHYLHSDQAGRGMAIAGEAFRGPMAAQQGINLVNSRLWVTEGGARLLKEYRNADKAAGRDLVTYKVYSATGMLVKQTQDSVDALRAIEEIERERVQRMTKPSPLTPAGVGESITTLTEAASMNPPEPRRTTVPLKKQRLERIRGIENYLPRDNR